jgi:hypothetical protein
MTHPLPRLAALVVVCTLAPEAGAAEEKPLDEREPPFADGDWSWLNGSNRQPSSLLKWGPLTGSIFIDAYYAFQFSGPQDHTIFPTTAAPRHNEMALNLVALGVEVADLGGPIGRLYLQAGSNEETIWGQDATTQRGQFLTLRTFAPVQQAGVGWHFHALHGVNVEGGIFPSYFALESYFPQENWNYMHPFVSDFTPYYFAGIRNQWFLLQDTKLELWVVNGWQTFGQWHETRAGGYQLNVRPSERLSLNHSTYLGKDEQSDPHAVRFYTDNFVQWQWLKGGRVKSSALALVGDLGWEHRSLRESGLMGGGSLSSRTELDDRWAFCLRADVFYDQTQALVTQLPLGSIYQLPDRGSFLGGGMTATLDLSPSPWLLLRLEYMHRWTNIPYFSGPGGITGPGGVAPAGPASSFTPDLRKSDDRMAVNATLRL